AREPFEQRNREQARDLGAHGQVPRLEPARQIWCQTASRLDPPWRRSAGAVLRAPRLRSLSRKDRIELGAERRILGSQGRFERPSEWVYLGCRDAFIALVDKSGCPR